MYYRDEGADKEGYYIKKVGSKTFSLITLTTLPLIYNTTSE